MEITERIIMEAGQLFGRYGIRSITMDSLAEEMGISKRTIYENFKDKDTLLLQVITYFKERQMEQVEQYFRESENSIEAFFKVMNSMINNMKQVNPLFFQDMKKYHPQIFSRLQDHGDIRDHSITRRMFQSGMEQGIIRNDLNMEILNITLHELFNLFSPDSSLTIQGFHRGELFDNIIMPYLLGISTDEGRKLIEQYNSQLSQHTNNISRT